MKNAPPLLALLLVLSLPAMTVVAASPSTTETTTERPTDTNGGLVEADNTTNRLVLEGEIRSGYVPTGPDLGTTLMARDDALRADYDLFVVENEFHELTNDERGEAIDDAYDRLEQRIEVLEQRERAAASRHANGEISDRQLVSTLVRNYNDAKALSEALNELDTYADRTPRYDRPEISDTESTLLVFQSDVRTRLDAISRDDPLTRDVNVVVDTTASGVSVSMVDDGTYVRETTRFDNRQPNEYDYVRGIDTAISRFEDRLYPWTFDNRIDTTTFSEFQTTQLYTTRTSTVQGTLVSYLDGGSEGVYHEFQELMVTELPSTPIDETWTNESLELSVNETPVNGPIEVTVTDETGDPVDATILVDDYELGETDDDGQLWLVPPAGEFELTAQTDDNSLDATISAGIDRT